MSIVGLDIGGANLKAARTDGSARIRPFALWKNPGDLTVELQALLRDWPLDRLAVTMTGELCDCFANRREGVRHILQCLTVIAKPDRIRVWRTDGQFASVDETLADPLPAASANWLALATFAGRFAPTGSAVLIDIGSTTTDIVPLFDGIPVPKARTDLARLECRELICTGARRTPVCALLEPGQRMAEYFATTLDVYLMLFRIAEDHEDCGTADGRPATRQCAHARLARMLGGDAEDISASAILSFARSLAGRQRELIHNAFRATTPEPGRLIVAGAGSFLVRDFQANAVDLSDRLGAAASSAACAFAVATLLNEGEHRAP